MAFAESAFAVAIGGKADMPFCTANVCLWSKADLPQIGHERVKFALRWVLIAEDLTW